MDNGGASAGCGFTTVMAAVDGAAKQILQQVDLKMKSYEDGLKQMQKALEKAAGSLEYIAQKQSYIEQRSCQDADFEILKKRQLKEQEVKFRANMLYMQWHMKMEVNSLVGPFLESKAAPANLTIYGGLFLVMGSVGGNGRNP